MLRTLTIRAWGARHQFAKYVIVGASGFVIDMVSLIALREVAGFRASVAVIINQAFLMLYNFNLNKYWSFGNRDLPHRQFVRYMTLAGVNYLFAVIAMYVFSDSLGWDYRLVRLGSVILAVLWNFVLYKRWVYR